MSETNAVKDESERNEVERLQPVVMNAQSLVNRIKYLERVNASLVDVIKSKDDHIAELREDAQLIADFREPNDSINRVWIWQGDGEDYPESMASDLPILIRAYQLRAMLNECS